MTRIDNTTIQPSSSTIPNLGFLEYLTEGVLILDETRTIRAVNKSLENMLGWKAAQLVGRPCQDIFDCQHPDTATVLCQNLCPILALNTLNLPPQTAHYEELSIATHNQGRRVVCASFSPLTIPFLSLSPNPSSPGQTLTPKDAGRTYTIIVLRDITEQKQQEKIKVEFIATASHQLRTPLASMKTSIGLLLENAGEGFNPLLRRLLLNIQNSSLRMERLVNDLIELTSLQSGRVQMHRRAVEAQELVNQAVELNRERLEARKQSVTLVFPPGSGQLQVEADFARLGQVLGHLLSNASKFSPNGTAIELLVWTNYNKEVNTNALPYPQYKEGPTGSFEINLGEEVIFSVRDQGIGISPEEQDLIFEKFYQSQVTENNVEAGGGLGLPLAKALIELNGGRLWFESEPGQGSTFSFALPLLATPTF
jgi:signal transduction histidine kinase